MPILKISNHNSGAYAGGIKFESFYSSTVYQTAAIYGYGGKRYLEGKKSMMGLYSWYIKRGFIENKYLNTHYKYFDMTPLPAMEFILGKWSMKTICLSFLDNKKIEE